eukprot:3320552-Rhodomonas_salina.6
MRYAERMYIGHEIRVTSTRDAWTLRFDTGVGARNITIPQVCSTLRQRVGLTRRRETEYTRPSPVPSQPSIRITLGQGSDADTGTDCHLDRKERSCGLGFVVYGLRSRALGSEVCGLGYRD